MIMVTELGCRHGNQGPTSLRKSGVGGKLGTAGSGGGMLSGLRASAHPQLVWDQLSNLPNSDRPPWVTHLSPDSSLGHGSGGSDDQGGEGRPARPCFEGGLSGAETP